jgi:AcrR family transcriptional regulator
LTPDVQEKIVQHIRRGFTLHAAAVHAGISKTTFWYWFRRGQGKARNEFSDFSDSVRAALEERREVRIKANPRHLARARYEGGMTAQQIALKLSEEVMRTIEEGRVPWNVALTGLGIAVSEIEDKLAEESLSWAENFTPAYDNDRGRMEDSDE